MYPGLIMLLVLSSCRSYVDYQVVGSEGNGKITADAGVWQGQYEYLSLEVSFNTDDSLTVMDISVQQVEGNSIPEIELYAYHMFSFYFDEDKKEVYWRDYSAATFDQLPLSNRVTRNGSTPIRYSLRFRGSNQIREKNFAVIITAILREEDGSNVHYTERVTFNGKRRRYFSLH